MRRVGAMCLVGLVALFVGAPRTPADGRPGPGTVFKTKQGAVQVFPRNNAWNQDISRLPVHPNSANYIKSIGADGPLKADFGTTWQGVPNGIPFCIVTRRTKMVKVRFKYADESDGSKYPIPKDPPIEGGPKGTGDRHILMLDMGARKLYELYDAHPNDDGTWRAGSGAIFDLTKNKLRPTGWTSADAAGLPIFPGLVKYEEAVLAGRITHALRFTVRRSQKAFIKPATHHAGRSDDPNLPPMGLRLRLKASFRIKGFPKQVRPILQALKTYGMFVADNGSDWFVSGAPHPKWNDDQLRSFRKVKGSDFEAVQTGKLIKR